MGGLRIERENDAYKCPKEGCNKNFRKENLLQMHLKHYHPEYNRFVASTPNVADLAYARTVGEPIDELMPHTRFDTTSVALARRGGSGRGSGVMSGTGNSAVVDPDGPTASVHAHSHISAPHPSASPPYVTPTHTSRRSTPAARRTKIESDGSGETIREDSSEAPSEVVAKPTIKTLLPVVRAAVVGSEAKSEDQKSDSAAGARADVVDAGQNGDVDAGPPPLTPALAPTPTPTPGSSGSVGVVSSQPVGQTKSLRTVRRRYMSDFHMEPLLKKRKTVKMPELVPEDVDVGPDESSGAGVGGTKVSATYRFSRKKMPVVHLEKLQVTTDSNGHVVVSSPRFSQSRRAEKPQGESSVQSQSEVEEPTPTPVQAEVSTRPSRVETLRREELINCTCGYPEEDGLMIQCDLCLCWQHGLCNNIDREEDVPEKYVCFICLHPSRERRSKRFLHDQDWLKEGALPSLSFRSKNALHVAQREAILKRSHDLTGTLLQLRRVVHSLRVKVNIAEKLDHPKLYLWARSWEKGVQEGPREGQRSSTKVKQELGTMAAGGNGACQTFLPAVPRGELDFPPPATATEQVPCDPVNDTESTEGEEKKEVVADDGDTKETVQKTDQETGQEPAGPHKEEVCAEERDLRIVNQSREITGGSAVNEAIETSAVRELPPERGTPTGNTETDGEESKANCGDKGAAGSVGVVTEEKERESQLQFPICQSELMDLATSMVSSMISSTGPKAETERQRAHTSPPVPPRAPQPEAPIDPMECRLTLLDHIEHFHQQVDSRLTSLETQIAALESMDPYLVHDEASDPRTKETVQMLLRDLATLRDVAAFN